MSANLLAENVYYKYTFSVVMCTVW